MGRIVFRRLALFPLVALAVNLPALASAQTPAQGFGVRSRVAEATVEDTVLVVALRAFADASRPVIVLDTIAPNKPGVAEAAEDSTWLAEHPQPSLERAWLAANAVGRRPVFPPELAPDRPLVVVHTLLLPRTRYYTVSRVGFSATGDSAMVRVTDVCGPLCGGFTVARLVRDPKVGWRIDSVPVFVNY